MKYRKLYERVVDSLVADGLIAAPVYAPEGRVMPVAPGADRATLAENTVVAALALSRVYALCYDDAPVALSVVSQVAREFGVNLGHAADGVVRQVVPEVTRWQCEGCTFATADVERMSGHYRATGHMNRRAVPEQVPEAERAHGERYESAPAAFAARMNPAPAPAGRPDPSDWVPSEDQAVQAVALRKVLDVLAGWVETTMENDEARGVLNRPAKEWVVVLHPADVRSIVESAAEELGVTL